ncbi:hypothetical protein EV359DRAFT_66491 [Lentinula novae-zelandiae]|nr:hypothetical protein EV359DRAFT_66491 [Lentinula novae-zelandiae]
MRFYRWHIDAALYDLSPPRVTTLYAICRYDDGTGDELEVPLATTAFVSGQTRFQLLPSELKSVAVRADVKYAPHPYVWMAPAHAKSTGLGIESKGLETPLEQLPSWVEDKIKIPSSKVMIKPLPPGASRENALYQDSVHPNNSGEVKDKFTISNALVGGSLAQCSSASK